MGREREIRKKVGNAQMTAAKNTKMLKYDECIEYMNAELGIYLLKANARHEKVELTI